MKIGIIGAMQMEIDNLKESLENSKTETVSGVEFVSGTVAGVEVVAAVCGIGKVFAAICTEAMILKYKVDMIVNIGVAGTLCKELGVMDVAVADKVVQHDMNTSALGDPVGLLSGINQIFLPCNESMMELLEKCLADKGMKYKVGTIATGDMFMHKAEQKAKLHERFEAIAGDGRWKYRPCMLCEQSSVCDSSHHFRWGRRSDGLCDICGKSCRAWYRSDRRIHQTIRRTQFVRSAQKVA